MINKFFPDFSKRSTEPELMDLPDADETKLINTVKQFTLINTLFTGSRSIISKVILKDITTSGLDSFTLLDIGAGGCDIPIWLVKKCRSLGVRAQILCLDYDPKIIRYAREKCKGYPEISVLKKNAFELESLHDFDYMFTNHFLHHLTTEQIIDVIRQITKKTKRIFVLHDIERSFWGYVGYSLFTGIFLRNSFSFYDGRLSILKGFTHDELKSLVNGAQFSTPVDIKKVFPSHFALVGRKKSAL